MRHQRWTTVPIGGIRLGRDIIAFEPRDWDCGKCRDPNAVCKFGILGNNRIKPRLILIDQVHLIDGQNDILNTEQVTQITMATRLR